MMYKNFENIFENSDDEYDIIDGAENLVYLSVKHRKTEDDTIMKFIIQTHVKVSNHTSNICKKYKKQCNIQPENVEAQMRCCQICGVVKTPLWRRTMDYHTLCNACGIRQRTNKKIFCKLNRTDEYSKCIE